MKLYNWQPELVFCKPNYNPNFHPSHFYFALTSMFETETSGTWEYAMQTHTHTHTHRNPLVLIMKTAVML